MMRIAISADNDNGLDSVVSPHFGRCPYFVLVDMEGQEVTATKAVNNPYYGNHRPGQVPAFIDSHDVNVMLTGGMGRRAIMFFEQFGIQPVTGAAGTVRQSLERYLGGGLHGAAPCRESVEHAHEHDVGGYEKDEVGRLREEAEMLRQQLDEATARLDKMEE
jgi:predicted Fe-Mo cluster-binding NifX family protein